MDLAVQDLFELVHGVARGAEASGQARELTILERSVLRRLRVLIDAEISSIRERSGQRLDDQQAGAVLAFVVGALVVGAFAPKRTAGFAEPGLRALLASFAAR